MTFSAIRNATATINARSLTEGLAIPSIDATASNSGFGSTATALRPSGTVDGDLMIIVQTNDATRTVTQPGGLTEELNISRSNATNNHRHTVWSWIASSAPASWSFTISSPESWQTFVYRISGHDPTTPVVDTDVTSDIIGSPFVIPAVTSVITNCLLLELCASGGAMSSTMTGPGTGESIDYNNTDGVGGTRILCASKPTASGGGTGTNSWTISSASESRDGFHCYIQPIPGSIGLVQLEENTDNILLEDASGYVKKD